MGLPFREPGPRPKTPSADFQCQPIKGTDGVETQPDLEVAPWVSNYDSKVACFLSFSFSFILFFFLLFLKLSVRPRPPFSEREGQLTGGCDASSVLFCLPGIRDLSISFLELLLYVRIHTEDFIYLIITTGIFGSWCYCLYFSW